MDIRYFQKGFNYSQDGPGNRMVIHLQGCNMRCPWCSNPEGMDPSGGKVAAADELLETITSAKRLYFGGGGVTFTGGECTLRSEALAYLLKECRKAGVNTAIETNGTFPYERALFDDVDFLICDFKHYDAEKLRAVAGGNGKNVENAAAYVRSGRQVVMRTVLINGFSASADDAEHFASFFDGFDTSNVRFEFLAYHEYGKSKWKAAGLEYKMHDAFVAPGTVEYFEKIFHEHGLMTVRS